MCFSVNIAKILRIPIFGKICKQRLLQFLLLTTNIFLSGFLLLLIRSLFSSRSSLRFKEFSLGCLVADPSLIRTKKELAKLATLCYLLSLVVSFIVTRCTTRLSFCKQLSVDNVSKIISLLIVIAIWYLLPILVTLAILIFLCIDYLFSAIIYLVPCASPDITEIIDWFGVTNMTYFLILLILTIHY